MDSLEALRKEWEDGTEVIDELRRDEVTLLVVLYNPDGGIYRLHTYMNFIATARKADLTNLGWQVSVDAEGRPEAVFKALFKRLR